MPKKFRGPTKAQAQKLEKLRAAVDTAMWAVFAHVDGDTRFSVAMETAPRAAQQAYQDAVVARADFERQLEMEGRGWREHGLFHPYN